MKKKIVLSIIAVILIALIAFCLVYTRPRPLSSLLGDREIKSISALALEASVSNGKGHYDVWELQGNLVTDQVLADLTSLMEREEYCISLLTLTQPSSYDLGSNPRTIHIGIMLEDGVHTTITLSGSRVRIHGERDMIASTDPAVSNSLFEYIAEYGITS